MQMDINTTRCKINVLRHKELKQKISISFILVIYSKHRKTYACLVTTTVLGKLGPSSIWRQTRPRTFWGPICHFLANCALANWAPWRQIGPRQIGPRQIGPLGGKLGPGKWGPGILGPLVADWAPEILLMANWAPANWAPG